MNHPTVAVLFARADSIYKSMPGCDVYDQERDARTWPGGFPVVAHPPCRAWGRLRTFARPEPGERQLAIMALHIVRCYGGVLEHPKGSLLWKECGLPGPSDGMDQFGGWTLRVPQQWWGHRAEKMTDLYIVGVAPNNVPDIPFVMGEAERVVAWSRAKAHRRKKHIGKAEREHTPPQLAAWLVELARRVQLPQYRAA